jgi:hypothetical protein
VILIHTELWGANMMRFHSLLVLAFSVVAFDAGPDTSLQRPVIDVHLHAGPKNWTESSAPGDPVNDEHLRSVLSQMDRHNVKLAVISGPMDFVEYWKKKAPDRFIASVMFPCDGGRAPLGGPRCFSSNTALPDINWIRERYSNKSFGAM